MGSHFSCPLQPRQQLFGGELSHSKQPDNKRRLTGALDSGQHEQLQPDLYAGRWKSFVGQHFRARGYWVSTVGKNEAAVRRYIQEQEKEDQRLNQPTLMPL